MTPELAEFLRTLLPTVLAILLGGGAFVLQYINIRKENIKREEADRLAKAEIATERQKLENDRAQSELKNQEFVRQVAIDLQKQVQEVKQDCETELDALRKKSETDLAAKSVEISGLTQQVTGLQQQVTGLQGQVSTLTEQNTTLLADNATLKSANETLQAQHVEDTTALTTEREKNGKLERDVERMREEVKSFKERLDAAEETIKRLEKKPTGELDPSLVPPTDPAAVPPPAAEPREDAP